MLFLWHTGVNLMLISELFKTKNIKLPVLSTGKIELFKEMVDFLSAVENLGQKEDILDRLWERENKITTGIAPHIAIPHAYLPGMEKTVGALGISFEGINYDALDGKPVNVILLILGSSDKPNEHLKILKDIALIFGKPDFYQKLINCKTPLEVNSAFAVSEVAVK